MDRAFDLLSTSRNRLSHPNRKDNVGRKASPDSNQLEEASASSSDSSIDRRWGDLKIDSILLLIDYELRWI